MSYQALYRVWRPQTFSELVGQKVITETLTNAVQHQQLSHAYLFTGPRGTGKTSAAKILAKAVNCENQHDGNPCNECATCLSITKGESADVIEIDAASNNGVEEIREIRDKVRYAPNATKYKVYIIDEVHMLTTGAFNALLKTLEEPPAHVIFILATTEPHKIPATIISRTQRFDFQRFHIDELVGRMSYILDHNQVPYEQEALELIARTANGGMRDSLSLLDQALSYQNELTVESALEVSGSISHLEYVHYILDIYQNDGYNALEIVRNAMQKGKQASRFIEELILFARDVLLSEHTQQNVTLLPQEALSQLQEVVNHQFYFKMIDALNHAQSQMRLSNQPDLYLEVVTIQLANYQVSASNVVTSDTNVTQLLAKVTELENKISQLEHQLKNAQPNELTTSAMPTEKELPRVRPQTQGHHYEQTTEKIYDVLDCATRPHIERLKQEWLNILEAMSPQDRMKFSGTTPLAAGPGYALINFKNMAFCGIVQHDTALQQQLSKYARQVLDENIEFVYIIDNEWQTVRQNYKILRDQNGGKPLKAPKVELVNQFVNDLPNDDARVETPIVAMSIQESFAQAPVPVTDNNANQAQEVALELPTSVTKAIELFGEENITVYLDR